MFNTYHPRFFHLSTFFLSVLAVTAAATWPVSVFVSIPVFIVMAVLAWRHRPAVSTIERRVETAVAPSQMPVYGESEETSDPYRIVDDTQASLIFNRLADVIVDTAYQTLDAHSVFLYVISHDDQTLVLEAFRSQSRFFKTRERLPFNAVPSLQTMIQTRQPRWVSEPKSFCYTEAVPVKNQFLFPVAKRDTVLGLLGVDCLTDVRDRAHIEGLVKQYGDLVLHAIQTVDAVHTRNVLKRWLSSLGTFVRQHRTTSEREVAHRLMDAIQECVSLDGMQVWMWAPDRSEPVLCGSRGQEADREQWIIPIAAGDDEWGFIRCLVSDPSAIAPIDREALKFIASTSCLIFERCREATVPASAPAGAFDRRRFENRLQKEIVRAQRFKTRFAVAVWTLRIPRDYQGTEGEKLLLDKIDGIFRNSTRAVDEAGRIQAAQFAVLLAECSLKQVDPWLNRAWSEALLHLEDDLTRMKIDVEIGIGDSTAIHGVDDAWKVTAAQTRRPPTPEQIKLL